jgi:hypothetical protein
MGGSEDGDGKGAKAYAVTGMTDALEWVDDKGEGNGKEDDNKMESGGAAEASSAARRMRMAKNHMDVQWAHPVD